MIGERNLVEVVIRVVGVEGCIAAVARLHAVNPLGSPLYALPIAIVAGLQHRPGYHRRIVDVGVVIVAELKRPATAAHARTAVRPVAFFVEQLARPEPVESAQHAGIGSVIVGLLKRQASQARVPYRRHTGLAVGVVGLLDDQAAQGLAGHDAVRMVGAVAEDAESLVGIHHGGENGSQTVATIETIDDPVLRVSERPGTNEARHHPVEHAAHAIECQKYPVERRANRKPVPLLLRRHAEQLANADTARIGGARFERAEHEQRHHHRA